MTLAMGDTLYTGPKRALPPIPTFSPELFGYLRSAETSKSKQFQKGVAELLSEGAVQVMYSRDAVKQVGRADDSCHATTRVLDPRCLT